MPTGTAEGRGDVDGAGRKRRRGRQVRLHRLEASGKSTRPDGRVDKTGGKEVRSKSKTLTLTLALIPCYNLEKGLG